MTLYITPRIRNVRKRIHQYLSHLFYVNKNGWNDFSATCCVFLYKFRISSCLASLFYFSGYCSQKGCVVSPQLRIDKTQRLSNHTINTIQFDVYAIISSKVKWYISCIIRTIYLKLLLTNIVYSSDEFTSILMVIKWNYFSFGHHNFKIMYFLTQTVYRE